MQQGIEYSDLIKRVAKLEEAVFGKGGHTKKLSPKNDDNYNGATGGLRLLLAKGFFDKKRFFSEVETELKNKGYHYSKQAVQTPLNNLSKKGGPLVGFKEKGKKVYAKRK